MLGQALPLIDMLWRHRGEGRSLATPEARAGFAAALEADIALIPDRTVQHYYRQAVRDRLYKSFGPQKQAAGTGKPSPRGKNNARGGWTPYPVPDHTLPRRGTRSPDLHGRIMLAVLLNHPQVFDHIEEALCRVDTGDSRLESLKYAALAALADNHTLERDALHAQLGQGGYADDLTGLLSAALYIHAGFARPDALPEQILAGWQDMTSRLNSPLHAADQRKAMHALNGDFSPENERRLLELAEKPQ